MNTPRLALLVLLLPMAAQGADDFKSADRTLKVRGILLKHCAGCHGETPRDSTLSVTDHASLLKQRPTPTVAPRDVSTSQLLALVEEGSMPPGNLPKLSQSETTLLREWITDGAGAYPSQFRDEFAWNVIADDAAKLPPADLSVTRYLTMHHLAGDDQKGFSDTRAGLLSKIRKLLRNNDKTLQAVDPTAMVFRLNLREAGWNAMPFVELDSTSKLRPNSKINTDIFDLFLLDYPFGRFPVGTPVGDRLAERFVDKAKMIRPIPFVHADWFVHLLTGTELGGEVARLLKSTELKVPEGLTEKPLPAPPIPVGDATSNVHAIDAWNANDPPVKNDEIPGLEFFLINSKTGQKTTKFKPGDQLKLHIKADVAIYFEVLWEDRDRAVNLWTERVDSLLPGKAYEVDFPKDGPLSDELGTERLTLFVSTHEFARGQALRTKLSDPKSVDRFVHPFYLFDVKQGKYSYQPSSIGIERRSVRIEIAK